MVVSTALCLLALAKPKPLMEDFIGLNVHTVQFRPDLYRPVAKRLRNYHPYNWDVAEDTGTLPKYPFAHNRVNWEDLYGTWKANGFTTSACVMFDQILPAQWRSFPKDGEAFGRNFAQYFGRDKNLMVEAIEIGNEPGKYTDEEYRQLFQSVAKGVRAVDPRLKIATCAMFDRKSGDYHKSLDTVKGLTSLIDVVNLHSYAEAEPYPTWRRSYPEDPKTPFLKEVQAVIDWRNRNAPGKEVWLTEFGWDSTTQPQAKEGTFSRWVGNTDLEQAQWIVRAYLWLATMDLDRGYLFWFNDNDEAQIHGSSGLTRKYQPKPSYHAVDQLQRILGKTRLTKIVRHEPGAATVLEFRGKAGIVWVAWSPTGSQRTTTLRLPKGPLPSCTVEAMATTSTRPIGTAARAGSDGSLVISLSESPSYLMFKE